jgi:hypothetical protein
VSDIETMLRAQAEADDRAAPAVTAAEARARARVGNVEVAALIPSERPRRRLAAAAVVLLVLAIGLATVVALGTNSRSSIRQTTPSPPRSEMPIGWSAIPASPFANRSAPVLVWTGHELLVVGGYTVHGALADGGAFDPSTRTWTVVPSGPFAFGANDAFAVWDGHDLLVWQTVTTRSNPALLGAAYNPSTRAWRSIAPSPLPARTGGPWSQVAVWAGTEVVAWSAAPAHEGHIFFLTHAATYDPVTGTWQIIDAGPLDVNNATAVWTGTEVEFFGWIDNHADGISLGRHPAAAYSPHGGTWHLLPFTLNQASPAIPVAATWTGNETVVWGADSHANAYHPATGRGTTLPNVPVTAGECYPQAATADDSAFAYVCGMAAQLDPTRQRWHRVATPLRALEASQLTYTTGPTSAGTGVAFWTAGAPSTEPQGWWYEPTHG